MFRFFLLAAAALTAWAAGAFEIKNTNVGGVRMTQVDSPYFRITVNPLGGRFWSIYSKPPKKDTHKPNMKWGSVFIKWRKIRKNIKLRGNGLIWRLNKIIPRPFT